MLCPQSFTHFSSYPAAPLRMASWAHSGSWGGTVGPPQVFPQQQAFSMSEYQRTLETQVESLLTFPLLQSHPQSPASPPHLGWGKWRLIHQGHFCSGKVKESTVLRVQKASNIKCISSDSLKMLRQVLERQIHSYGKLEYLGDNSQSYSFGIHIKNESYL